MISLNFVNSATAETNPMRLREAIFLYIVGYGDIILAAFAFASMWCGRNTLRTEWRKYGKGYAAIPFLAIGVLTAFRIIVTLGVGPWVGIWLAFTPPEQDKFEACFWAAIYFFFSMFLIYVLVLAFRKAVAEGHHVQRLANEYVAEERLNLLSNVHTVRSRGH